MATRREARFKLCRRFGVNVFGHAKALNRVKKDQRQKKMSEYGTQLLEKQKVKAYYNLLERQFVRYYDKAKKCKCYRSKHVDPLEQRLDNLVYRIGFGNSIRQARQMVNHGHILVNGRRVDIPSFSCKPGDVIELREASRDNEMFKTNFQELRSFELPYIEKTSKLHSLVFLNVKNFLSKLTKHLSSNCTPNNCAKSAVQRTADFLYIMCVLFIKG